MIQYPINLFWDGAPLEKFELLNLKSFLVNDHNVNVFTYNRKIFDIVSHKNLSIIDANEIINKSELFYYKGHGDCPINSVCGFSDIFRYELLYRVGGWYLDFDITCLKNFNDTFFNKKEIVIKPHNKFSLISNTIKMPKGHNICKVLREETEQKINKDNNSYIRPLEIFKTVLYDHGVEQFTVSNEYFGNDDMKEIYSLLHSYSTSKKQLKNRYCIHWCRTAIKTGTWSVKVLYDLNNPLPDSFLSYLYFKYT